MDGFVAKPIAVDEVLQLVSQIARQSRTDTPEPVTDDIDSCASAGEGSLEPRIPEADGASFKDFLSAEGHEYFDSSPYLLAIAAAGMETNSFSGATKDSLNEEIDHAGDIAIAAAEDLAGADFNDNVLHKVPQSHTPLSAAEGLALLEAACELTQHSPSAADQAVAEAATGTEMNGFSGATRDALNAEMDEVAEIAVAVAEDLFSESSHEADSDDNRLQEIQQSPTPLSAGKGLALLESACQLTQHSPSPVKQADDPPPAAARDPFEQARKSLSKASFGIRVVHNDGDPSDRNLI
jgi:hypothetical protein